MLRFDEYFETWADILLRSQMDDALKSRSQNDKQYFIAHTRMEIASLRAAVGQFGPIINADGANEVKPLHHPSVYWRSSKGESAGNGWV